MFAGFYAEKSERFMLKPSFDSIVSCFEPRPLSDDLTSPLSGTLETCSLLGGAPPPGYPYPDDCKPGRVSYSCPPRSNPTF